MSNFTNLKNRAGMVSALVLVALAGALPVAAHVASASAAKHAKHRPSTVVIASYSDGTFSSSNWTTATYAANSYCTATTATLASGGDPGAFMRNNVSFPNSMPKLAKSRGAVLAKDVSATWTPGSSGYPFDHIAFTWDEISYDGQPDEEHLIAVWQSGKCYVGTYGLGQSDGANWYPKSNTAVQSDFAELNLNSSSADYLSLDASSHPDFTSTGSTVTLGMALLGTHGYTQGAIKGGMADVDNFSVQVYGQGGPESGLR